MDRQHLNMKAVIVSVLTTGAAALIAFAGIGFLGDPSGIYRLEKSSLVKPETLNIQLNWLQGVLAPVDRILPPDAPLRYVGQEEAFTYFLAVLAPRRIAPDLDSPFILALCRPDERQAFAADLRNTQLLVRLSDQIEILQQGDRHLMLFPGLSASPSRSFWGICWSGACGRHGRRPRCSSLFWPCRPGGP